MSALHIFDMDGTLLRDSTASIEISRSLGCLEPLTALEASFAAGRISAPEFSLQTRELWADLTAELVRDSVAAAPWIAGISEVCADIAARGESSMLITISPDFFAAHLRGFGLDHVAASRFPPLPFTAPLDPAGILEPADKVRLAARQRATLGLSAQDCVAYGDSMSDLPLFAELKNTVAVNADRSLAQLAAVAYRGDSLVEAYTLGRKLLDRR